MGGLEAAGYIWSIKIEEARDMGMGQYKEGMCACVSVHVSVCVCARMCVCGGEWGEGACILTEISC